MCVALTQLSDWRRITCSLFASGPTNWNSQTGFCEVGQVSGDWPGQGCDEPFRAGQGKGCEFKVQFGEQLRAKKVGLTPLYVAEKMPSPTPFAAAILGIWVSTMLPFDGGQGGGRLDLLSWSQSQWRDVDVAVVVIDRKVEGTKDGRDNQG